MREPVLGHCLLETFCFDRVVQNHYYARPMQDRVCIDSVAFAREGGELRATVAIADLPRLHDSLFDRSGEIAYTLTGAVNKDGVASLRLDIAAVLVMTCQRCLGPVRTSLKSRRNFELVAQNQALGDPADEPDDVERMHANASLDVGELVEDEAILCMPMVAGHQPGECTPLVAQDESARKLPFSTLSALKRQ
ncbi:MAG TPA: YceD family protein [Burkholderiales bacterium]